MPGSAPWAGIEISEGQVAAERIAGRATGSVKIVDFVLFGQAFTAMSAGPLERAAPGRPSNAAG
jgi:hypothetical protein